MKKEMIEIEKITSTDEAWDDRELGADEKFVGVIDDSLMQQIFEASGTQLISIRMQKSLLEDFKLISSLNGLGYQTLMKQILQRFVDSEKKKIFRELVAEKVGAKTIKINVDDIHNEPEIKRTKVA